VPARDSDRATKDYECGPGNWVRVGTGQPAAPSVDLNVSPDQGYLLVATHGQGLWKLG